MTFTTTLSKEILELAEKVEAKIAPYHKACRKNCLFKSTKSNSSL